MTEKYTPSKGDYIDLKGKKYLPARRRVQWFRGEHPDWGIATSVVDLDFGAGYAVIRAEVTDAEGRLIASGMKSETRSGFADFVEKAETGAIARAVAIAGFGTEDALDLDEGERIADSPVAARTQPGPNGKSGGATPNARPAPARHRHEELVALMKANNLDVPAVERVADRIGIPSSERPMSPASMDRLIAAIEETSAWGRAIAALGFEVKRGIASREEVSNKQPGPNGKSDGVPTAPVDGEEEARPSSPPTTDDLLDAAVAVAEAPTPKAGRTIEEAIADAEKRAKTPKVPA